VEAAIISLADDDDATIRIPRERALFVTREAFWSFLDLAALRDIVWIRIAFFAIFARISGVTFEACVVWIRLSHEDRSAGVRVDASYTVFFFDFDLLRDILGTWQVTSWNKILRRRS